MSEQLVWRGKATLVQGQEIPVTASVYRDDDLHFSSVGYGGHDPAFLVADQRRYRAVAEYSTFDGDTTLGPAALRTGAGPDVDVFIESRESERGSSLVALELEIRSHPFRVGS